MGVVLSELIITKVVSINRVNRALGSYTVQNRPYSALCYKISGRSEYIQHGNTIPSDENRIVFIPAGASYRYTCHEIGECVILDFESEKTVETLESFMINNQSEILTLVDKIERAHRFKKTGFKLSSLSGFYRLLYFMESQKTMYGETNRIKKKIQPGITYLEDNCSDFSLYIGTLAQVSGISEIYFRKLFTTVYGMSPKKYINLIRINKAKELLLTHDVSIQQIAEEVGFNDVYSFCKAFKKAQACTPSEYRKWTVTKRQATVR